MPEVHRHEERDFKHGDKILIDGSRPGVVICVHSLIFEKVHGLDYKNVDGSSGWAHVSICRRVSDEEWTAWVMMAGK